jgi:hypothetical protein
MENGPCKADIDNLRFDIFNLPSTFIRAVLFALLSFSLLHSPLLGANPSPENPLRFLRALQQNGYGDMAVAYLEILEKRSDLPSEIREVLDLEMSKSLKIAAADAFDAKESEQLMKQSEARLGKFIRENGDHPASANASVAWGDLLINQALQVIKSATAKEGKDKEQQEKQMAEARALLTQAGEKFQQAEPKLRAKLASLPPPSNLPTKLTDDPEARDARIEAEIDVQEVQFQLALAEYYRSQTYLDPKSDEHLDALKKAAKAFDALFQRARVARGGISVTGLYAHLWHGKTLEELGDLPTAMDIYDEVLAAAPDPGDKGPTTGLEPLFTQVEHFRLLVLAKKKPVQFLSEANSWLKLYRRLKHTDGYQAIALEVAKTLLAQAEKATGPAKGKRTSEALQILIEMAKIPGPYQQEAMRMRLEILKSTGRGELEAGTFDDAVAMGNIAASASQWDKAQESYQQALDIAVKSKLKDASRLDAVHEELTGVRYMIARELFDKGKLNECIEMSGKIVRDDQGNVKKGSVAAAQASALGVNAALNLYVEAPEDKKAAALDKLMKVAEFTETNWPDRPEADDARMARGQAKLVVGAVRDAIALFDRVNPKSERYALACFMAGKSYEWLYASEKKKPEKDRNAVQMNADRAKAAERFAAGLQILGKQFEPGKPLPKNFLEMQLMLAQIHFENNEAKEAAALYQPLVDALKAEKPPRIDATTIPVFLGAVRAYSALNELDKAGEVSAVLIDLGPDTPQVNAVLVDFARLLNEERKKADALVTELESTTYEDKLAKAKARQASVKDLLGRTLLKLAERKELSLAGMVFIGDALMTIGKTAEASAIYQKIVKRTETDKDFAATAKPAMSRIRSQLIGLLRQEGKFDEAMKQVERLIKDNPNALEPMMEKGRILDAWSEKNPAKFNDAVAHWTMIRSRLQPMRKKPPEYFDVMYNVAASLMREAQKSRDKSVVADRAKKAEQVLKSALILSPKLNGPDTVARYNVLLNKAIALQGRPPEKKSEKKP